MFNMLMYSLCDCLPTSVINGDSIELELPGVKKKDIDIELIESIELRVSWNDRNGHKQKRVWYVNGNVTDVNAKLEDGMLTLSLCRSPPNSKKIKVT